MRQAWTTGTATLAGSTTRSTARSCGPLPLQPGGIPFWIAGGGERKTLRIAAQYAQYTNFDGEPEEFAHKSEILAEHCRDLGTDFDAIIRSGNYNVVIGETEKDVAERAGLDPGALRAARCPAEQVQSRLGHVHRRPRLRHGRADRRAAAGAWPSAGWATPSPTSPRRPTTAAGMELFAREVIPALAG